VEQVDVGRTPPSVDAYLEETLDLSTPFRDTVAQLSKDQWQEVVNRIVSLAEPFTDADGSLRLPGAALVATAAA